MNEILLLNLIYFITTYIIVFLIYVIFINRKRKTYIEGKKEMEMSYLINKFNLDMRKIASLSNSMGNNLGCIPNSNETGTILLKIKTERNNLGHGNKTFSSVGAELTINDLEKYKNIVIAFLDYIIEKFESYVADKKYKV